MRKIFTVNAVWDADAGVYYSESDISGLHIEAGSLDEFETEMFKVAADLIMANHVTDAELHSAPAREIIPAIVFKASLPRVA
jgi:hypothetical protein